MNPQLTGKISIVALVAIVSFLTAWQTSGPAWGVVSAIAIGGGIAFGVFRGRSPHHRRGLNRRDHAHSLGPT